MTNTIDESSERLAAFRSSVPFPSRTRLAAGRDRLLAATMTAAGQSAIEAAAPVHAAGVLHLVFDQLTEEELAAFGQACAKIRKVLEETPHPAQPCPDSCPDA